MYIIVWRNSHREPFVDTDSRQFLESYYSYEEAKAAAEARSKAEARARADEKSGKKKPFKKPAVPR